jgi:hypothetical protein
MVTDRSGVADGVSWREGPPRLPRENNCGVLKVTAGAGGAARVPLCAVMQQAPSAVQPLAWTSAARAQGRAPNTQA